MSLVKNDQNQYQQVTAVAGKTITTVEVFQVGSANITEYTCSDGTRAWSMDAEGVISIPASQPY